MKKIVLLIANCEVYEHIVIVRKINSYFYWTQLINGFV